MSIENLSNQTPQQEQLEETGEGVSKNENVHQEKHVVGLSPTDERVFLDMQQRNVKNTTESSFENERKKTEEELLMVTRATKNLNDLRGKYGLAPVAINPNQVRTITGPITNDGAALTHLSGGYSSTSENILITDLDPLAKEGVGRIDLIQHEVIHAGQYQNFQVHEETDGKALTNYRTGIEVRSRKPDESGEFPFYLTPLNEAITEENARRLTLQLTSDDPELGHVIKEREREFNEFLQFCKENPNHNYPQGVLEGDVRHSKINPKNGRPDVNPFSYYHERQAMWKLFDRIHEKNPDAFPGKSKKDAREIMFDMVTKASFDGNIMPFGRLMNDTFGLGTFRNYGHLRTPQEIVSLIDSLEALKKK